MLRSFIPARRSRSLLLLASLLAGGLIGAGPAAATSSGQHNGFDWLGHHDRGNHSPPRWGHIDHNPWPPQPGISLLDLVSNPDLTFESENGELTFGDFSARVHGMKPRLLDLYRVIPTEDGFSLWTPLSRFFGHNSKLDLGYQVDAAEGLKIEAVGISFSRGGLFGRRRATMDVMDEFEQRRAALEIWEKGCFWGKESDLAYLSDPATRLLIEEMIKGKTGLFGAHASVDHHFSTNASVPEPTTALMLGLGLVGLALSGGRGKARGRQS